MTGCWKCWVITKTLLTASSAPPNGKAGALRGWWRSLCLVIPDHSRPQHLVLPVMQGLHRTLGIYDGRLPNRHTWRHPPLAASTVRTSMGARGVMASAGSGRSCCLLRWHPATDVSTGRHQRFGSGTAVAPLPVGSTPWSDACGNTVSSRSRSDASSHDLCDLHRCSWELGGFLHLECLILPYFCTENSKQSNLDLIN